MTALTVDQQKEAKKVHFGIIASNLALRIVHHIETLHNPHRFVGIIDQPRIESYLKRNTHLARLSGSHQHEKPSTHLGMYLPLGPLLSGTQH